jgi:hypothetical protein
MPPKEFQPEQLENFLPRYGAVIVPSGSSKLDQTLEAPYGEIFDYSLHCLSVRNPDTGKSIFVSKDPVKDSKRPLDWRVLEYDETTGEVLELIVQNVFTIPDGDKDIINLELVDAQSPRFIDSRLSFALRKEDYKRDESQPVTLVKVVPYGQKPTVYEYPAEANFPCEKVNQEAGQKATESREHTYGLYRGIGHIADRAA